MNDNLTFASNAKKRTVKNWLIRFILLFIGLFIAHFGVVLFVKANMGTDNFTILCQGIAGLSGLTIGTAQNILMGAMMVVMLIFTRGYVKPGTIVCAFCGGWQIDLYMWLLGDSLSEASPMIIRIIAMVAGCFIIALGKAFCISSDAGAGPNDLFSLIISDKINKHKKVSFSLIRIICDVGLAFLGFALGGVLGVGTFVTMFLTGPILQKFLPPFRRFTNVFIAKLEGKSVEEIAKTAEQERDM